jgi:hypothetical protein
MRKLVTGFWIFLLGLGLSNLAPAAADVSKDGKFELTMEHSKKMPLESSMWQSTLRMWRLTGGKREALWEAELFGDPIVRDVIFARNGSFCIFAHGTEWQLIKNGKRLEFAKFHQQYPKEPSLFVSPQPHLLEFDDGDDPTVALWDREDDRWQAFAILSENNIEPMPELIAHWNELARRRILERIAHKEAIMETSLEFLAVRRNPEDRGIFEKLLRGENPVVLAANDWPEQPRGAATNVDDPYFFVQEDRARIVGDRLLAIFEQKPVQKEIYWHGTQKLFYLGLLSGNVELPTPILKDAGTIRILLKPEQGQENQILEAALQQQTRDQVDLSDEISFAFTTVTPGKYRVKAVWDKRSPFTDREQAGAGDYESSWSEPVEITAAAEASVKLECAHRVGDASLYSGDEQAAKDWKAGELSLWTGDRNGRTELFPGDPNHWISKTNFVADEKRFHVTRLTALSWPKSPTPPFPGRQIEKSVIPPPLIVEWKIGRRDGLNPAALKILDEHGCAFLPQEPVTNRHSAVATFPGFPRASATFRLAGYNATGALLFDYTITNRVRLDRKKLEAQALPLEMNLDGLNIRVASIKLFEPLPNLPAPSRGCLIEATVQDTRNATNNWRVDSGMFFDSHGNFIPPAEMCREEKVVGIFARATVGDSFSRGQSRRFEFAVERPKQ